MNRKIISNPRFQIRFAFAIERGILLAIFLPGATVILTLYLMSQHADIFPEQKDILTEGVRQLTKSFIWLSAGLTLIAGLVGLLLSQRFAGPVSRMEAWLTQHLMKENPAPLLLRKSDELGPLASLLNKIVSKG